MAINEIFCEPSAIGSSSRAMFATHGILCPCPGCKSVLQPAATGTGALSSADEMPGAPHARDDISAALQSLGFAPADAARLYRVDQERFGPVVGPRVAQLQIQTLQKMHVIARLACITDWNKQCRA